MPSWGHFHRSSALILCSSPAPGPFGKCRSLLKAGLVDRYRVCIFPVITGATGQDRVYDGYPDVRLELVEARTFDNAVQLLEYVPTVLEGPPGV